MHQKTGSLEADKITPVMSLIKKSEDFQTAETTDRKRGAFVVVHSAYSPKCVYTSRLNLRKMFKPSQKAYAFVGATVPLLLRHSFKKM